MKKYVNKSKDMQTVRFEDGSAVFLRRGQSAESSKKTKKVPEGVVVTEVKTSSKTKDTSAE